MSVDTYVYAMVGIHCKDVCTSKKETIRGCNHLESKADYCSECGNEMWTKHRVQTCLSAKLEHLQEWCGNDEGEVDESAISMIYSPMCGPNDFVVGKVLVSFDSDGGAQAEQFDVLTDEEYTEAYEQTKAALEPLGLWDPEKFGYLLYAIYM